MYRHISFLSFQAWLLMGHLYWPAWVMGHGRDCQAVYLTVVAAACTGVFVWPTTCVLVLQAMLGTTASTVCCLVRSTPIATYLLSLYNLRTSSISLLITEMFTFYHCTTCHRLYYFITCYRIRYMAVHIFSLTRLFFIIFNLYIVKISFHFSCILGL